MEKSHNNQSHEPVTKANLGVMKTEIIAAVKESVKGLATQETVSTVVETVAEVWQRFAGKWATSLLLLTLSNP